jgi:hypothetical protein
MCGERAERRTEPAINDMDQRHGSTTWISDTVDALERWASRAGSIAAAATI